MQWKPNVTVAAIIEQDDKFLVVEEYANDKVVINQPAGHLEQNETLIDAVKREVLEETAYVFVPQHITGIYMYPNPANEEITYMRVCFCGQFKQHFPENPLDDGIITTHWMSRDELIQNSKKLRSPMVLRCIDDYLDGQRHPLSLLNHYIQF